MNDFDILSEIRDVETIAKGHGVYIREYLDQTYGKGRWRKMKGFEAHGIGRKDFKIKRELR